MVVKQSFIIKEEVMKDDYELFGTNGCLKSEDSRIMLLDFAQMGQYVLENTLDESDDNEYEFSVMKKEISNMALQWANEIAKIIVDEIYENAVSDGEDDEEIKVIK